MWVAAATGLASALACSESAPDASMNAQSFLASDVLTMTARSDGQFDVVCGDTSRVVASATDIQSNRVCGGGAGGPIQGILYDASGTCEASHAVALVRTETLCVNLDAAQRVGHVSVNGSCLDIADTSAIVACKAIKESQGAPRSPVVYGTSDTCSESAVVARIGASTDCLTLSHEAAAWSVSVDGQCLRTRDTSVRAACLSVQREATYLFGTSDSCAVSTAIARLTAETDCLTLSESRLSWSVSTDGVCRNAPDRGARSACLAEQRGATYLFGRSDSCDPSTAITKVTAATDCRKLSASQASWSKRVDGECRDTPDTTLQAACLALQ